MTHNDPENERFRENSTFSPVQNNNLDEPGLYGIESSLDQDQQEQLTAFYRSVILHKNVCWGTGNQDETTPKTNRAVTEHAADHSNLYTDTTTNPGNLSYDHFNNNNFNSTSYSTRSNFNYLRSF